MKRIATCIALVGLLAMGGQAIAAIGTVDDVPAATLLLPYFAVNLNDPTQLTTLFSINNASAAPAIAHVTLWTDKSVPTLDFNVYLTGYDVYTVNLRDLFESGTVPPSDNTAVVGLFSLDANPATGVDENAAGCDAQLPLPPLPAVLLNHIRAAHTGQPTPLPGPSNGLCYGDDKGDNIARGYITVDNVNFCTLDFPNTPGYWNGDNTGTSNNVNQLWGDYFYVDELNNFAQGETLVHVEAGDAVAGPGPGDYTFYARYSGGLDRREGLGSTFATRFATSFGPLAGGTDLVVWRDAKQDQAPFPCNDPPGWEPLSQNQIVIFDEEENPVVPATSPFSPPIGVAGILPFPDETNSVAVGGPSLPVPATHQYGWLYLNLNSEVDGQDPYFDNNCSDPACMQNWVSTLMFAAGRFSVGYDAIQLDNVTFPPQTDLCLDDLGAPGGGDGGATPVCPLP